MTYGDLTDAMMIVAKWSLMNAEVMFTDCTKKRHSEEMLIKNIKRHMTGDGKFILEIQLINVTKEPETLPSLASTARGTM